MPPASFCAALTTLHAPPCRVLYLYRSVGSLVWKHFLVQVLCLAQTILSSQRLFKKFCCHKEFKGKSTRKPKHWGLFFWPSKSSSLLMSLSGLCMHNNRHDLKYPLLFSRSCRPLICHKIDSIMPLFPSENSKYPVHWFLTGTGHPERLLSLSSCRQWKADWTCSWAHYSLSLFEWEGWTRWIPKINSNLHDSMAILVACLSLLVYLSQQYHDLQTQPQQSRCLVIFQGFYWLSEKTLIQQMIITHFVCIELEQKAANTSEENTQSSSVKAFYLFICSHGVYKPMSIIIRWIISLYFALRPCFQKKQMAETGNSFWRHSSPYACTVMRPSKTSEQKG